ncbi:low temperature requirement protein LtrA [Rhodococcus sp. 27YEA15]|uniref:low temperature requirement protein A n=1 Tax=Rhodococcus sp. 27YEA15 TaxID=3156259 RepID=UPI003C7B719E
MTRIGSFIRPLVPRDRHEPHRVATPLELLTDLCFVVAVGQAAAGLHHAVSGGHAASGVGYFVMAFFAIWWTWLNFTWFNSAYDNDDGITRLLTLVQIIGVLVMAAGIERFFEGDLLLGILGYVIMRIALVIQWIRVARNDAERARTARSYALGIVVVQLGWIGFYFLVPTAVAIPVFVILALFEFSVPVVSERSGMTPWHPHHVAERYSLFFIIVLGETILAATLAIHDSVQSEHPAGSVYFVVIGGVLIVFSLWWLYFQRSAGDALEAGENNSVFVWGFGHYFIFAAAAAVGAGLSVRVDFWSHEGDQSALVTGAAVTVPVAVLLAAMWLIHIRPHDASARTLVPFSITVAVVLAATFTPVPELIAGLACTALLGVELYLTEGRKSVDR